MRDGHNLMKTEFQLTRRTSKAKTKSSSRNSKISSRKIGKLRNNSSINTMRNMEAKNKADVIDLILN